MQQKVRESLRLSVRQSMRKLSAMEDIKKLELNLGKSNPMLAGKSNEMMHSKMRSLNKPLQPRGR